ncbi:MAG: hypothetical protein DMF86_24505, partial [Acidobacteria bacterium]
RDHERLADLTRQITSSPEGLRYDDRALNAECELFVAQGFSPARDHERLADLTRQITSSPVKGCATTSER